MAEEYETLIHRWFEEVWNKRSEEAIDEMFAADGIANGLNDPLGNPVDQAMAGICVVEFDCGHFLCCPFV